MKKNYLVKAFAFVIITTSALACGSYQFGNTPPLPPLPLSTIISYSINLEGEYLEKQVGNTFFYKVPTGTEVIITASFKGPKKNVRINWKGPVRQTGASLFAMRKSPLKNEEKIAEHTWQYKAHFPASATIAGKPSRQITYNGIPEFINNEKKFVIKWEKATENDSKKPLAITLVKNTKDEHIIFNYTESKKGTFPEFTVSFKNISEHSIDLKDLNFKFEVFFKEGRESKLWNLSGKETSISIEKLEKGETYNLLIEAPENSSLDFFILNKDDVSPESFIKKIANQFNHFTFQAVDQAGSVVGEL